MAPLSRLRPKPLLPFTNTTLVDHAIARVRSATSAVAVNAHHHLEQMDAHLGNRVHLSVEDRPGLGTAGAVHHLRPWVDGRDLLVVNADTWCPGELVVLAESWDRSRVRVIVAGRAELAPDSRIVASFLPASVVDSLPPGPCGLYEVCWRPEADAGRLEVVGWDGPIVDCATPRDYLRANLLAARGHSVVGAGAVVEGHIERTVVWPGARVAPTEVLVDAIRTDTRVTVLIR